MFCNFRLELLFGIFRFVIKQIVLISDFCFYKKCLDPPLHGIPSILIIIIDLLNKCNKIVPVYAEHIAHLDQDFSLTV
jgi:hypothetical protein